MEQDDKVYAVMPAGTVEYSKSEAEVSIDQLIEALEDLKADGVTHVVGLSGNYRGGQYVRLGTPTFDDEEVYA